MKQLIIILPLILILSACVQNNQPRYSYTPPTYTPPAYTPPKYETTVTPSSVYEKNNLCEITLSPGNKLEGGLITSFILKIKNNTQKDITLNWNKTLFIEDGQTAGGFMFEGIVYSKRENEKPSDVIFADSNFEKTIWPNKLVFYSGGKYGSGWLHNELSGQCGIYLALESGNKEIKQKMLMNFDVKKIQ